MTKPLAGGNLSLRFGAALDGGNRQTEAGSLILAPDTVRKCRLRHVETLRRGRFAFRAATFSQRLMVSSWVQLDQPRGSIGANTSSMRDINSGIRSAIIICSISNRVSLPVDFQVPGKVPLPERFFGGNNEEFLIASDDWQIRANPVIRAIPGSKFFQTAAGAGGKEFFSYNFTAAYGIWRKTLVPEELTTDDDFKSELEGAITTVTSTLQNYYSSKDPALRERRVATACCPGRAHGFEDGCCECADVTSGSVCRSVQGLYSGREWWTADESAARSRRRALIRMG